MDRDPVFMDRDPDFMDRGPIFMDGGPVFMDGGPIFVDRGPVRRPAGRNGTLLVLSVQFHFPHEQTYFSLKRQCFFCPRPGVRGARTAVRGMDAVHESGTAVHEIGTAVHENGTAVHEIGTAVHENGTAVRPRIQGSYGEGQNAPFWIGLNLATLTRPAGLQGRPAHGGKSLDQKYMSGQVTRCPRDSAVRCI